MGCSPSRSQPVLSLSDKDKVDLRKIGYKVKDLKKLFAIFNEIDISSSKKISTYDIQTYCRIEDKVFLSSVFNTVARKDPSSLNFCEFCFCLLYFLTMDTHQLIVFLFRLYVKDKTQTVSLEDLQNIVALTEGAAVAKKTVHEVFIKLDFGNVSELHQSNFEIMFHHSTHFLRPLIQLQVRPSDELLYSSSFSIISL